MIWDGRTARKGPTVAQMTIELINLELAETLFRSVPAAIRPPSLSPKLVALSSLEAAAEVVHIRITDSQGWIVKTVYERRIENTSLKDWTSPYNYGATFMSGAPEPDRLYPLKAFARERNVIAEFLRFHPLTDTWKLNAKDVKSNRLTVSIPLSATQDPVDGFNSAAKRAFRKATKAGVTVERQELSSSEFSTRYLTAMRIKMARTGLMFSGDYFSALALHPSVRLYSAVFCERIIASVLVLVDDKLAEYHLGESDLEGRNLRASNLLFGEIARDLASDGLMRFHLGGGLTGEEDDSLLKFKLSLAGDPSVFRVGGVVYDRRYDAMETVDSNRFLHYRRID